jgi:hypothetical protein
MRTPVVAQLVSKKDQAARTPSSLIALAGRLFGLPSGQRFFDPCPAGWTPASGWDGLLGPWRAWNFVNPPFVQAAQWLRKAEAEAQRGNVSVVLLPCRFGARYAHRAVRSPHTRALVVLDGRIRFVGYANGLSVACCFFAIAPRAAMRIARLPSVVCAFAEVERALSPAALRAAVVAAEPATRSHWDAHALGRDSGMTGTLRRLRASGRSWITLLPQRIGNAQLIRALSGGEAQATFVAPKLTGFVESTAVVTNLGAPPNIDGATMHRRRVRFARAVSDHDERQTRAILTQPYDRRKAPALAAAAARGARAVGLARVRAGAAAPAAKL